MKLIGSATALAIAIGAVAPALAESITCESSGGRERYCNADTRGGVTLTTQLSSNGCYQGDTWGYDSGGIWVTGGCRAVFQTGGYYGHNYYQGNDYYSGDRHHKSNDGATAAIAIGAILGAALIASSASKKKSSEPTTEYQTYYDRGCTAGRDDRKRGLTQTYTRNARNYDDRTEQAYASGYNKCFSDR